MLGRDLPDSARVLRRLANPVVDLGRFYRIPLYVEEVEHAVGDVELVHRIDDASARSGRFHLSDAGGPHQLQSGALQRIVELLRNLVADHDEECSAEQEDDQPECRNVPNGETQPETYEPLDSGARRAGFSRQNGIRRPAESESA